MVIKYCINCKKRLELEIDSPDGYCPCCNFHYHIQKTLSDTRKAGRKGGFRLIPAERKHATLKNNILKYLSREKDVTIFSLCTKLGKSPETVRRHVREMKSEGTITINYERNAMILNVIAQNYNDIFSTTEIIKTETTTT